MLSQNGFEVSLIEVTVNKVSMLLVICEPQISGDDLAILEERFRVGDLSTYASKFDEVLIGITPDFELFFKSRDDFYRNSQ